MYLLLFLSVRRRSTADSTLLEDLERNRAQTFCIRCHSFRCSGRFRCGRCGDVFRTKPVFDNEPDEEESAPSGEGKSSTASVSSPSQNQEGAQKAACSDRVEQGVSPNAKPQDSSPSQQDGQQQQQHSRKQEDLSEVTPPPGRLKIAWEIVQNLFAMFQYLVLILKCVAFFMISVPVMNVVKNTL